MAVPWKSSNHPAHALNNIKRFPIWPHFQHPGNTNTATQPQSQRPSTRPVVTNPTRAPTRRPQAPTTTAAPEVFQDDSGPSRCVWAIVNCCTPQNRQVRYSCFERFGCGGAFWDINPCNEDVFDSAIDAADKFVEWAQRPQDGLSCRALTHSPIVRIRRGAY